MSTRASAVAASTSRMSPARPWLPPFAITLGCLAMVFALVDGVREKADLSSLDPGVTNAIVAARTPWLTVVAEALTDLASVPALITLAVVVTSALSWRWRSRGPLLTMGIALGGSAVLTYLVKALIARQRPPVEDVLGVVDHNFAFPSGHTLNSAVFLAVLCWLLRGRFTGTRRAVGAALAGSAALGVGLSRVYLGYHWMTDVLAAWAIAVGWLALLLAVHRRATFTTDSDTHSVTGGRR
jgi:membrane-associated phospholipid phosphatase